MPIDYSLAGLVTLGLQRVSTTLLRAFARMNAVKVPGSQSDALD